MSLHCVNQSGSTGSGGHCATCPKRNLDVFCRSDAVMCRYVSSTAFIWRPGGHWNWYLRLDSEWRVLEGIRRRQWSQDRRSTPFPAHQHDSFCNKTKLEVYQWYDLCRYQKTDLRLKIGYEPKWQRDAVRSLRFPKFSDNSPGSAGPTGPARSWPLKWVRCRRRSPKIFLAPLPIILGSPNLVHWSLGWL